MTSLSALEPEVVSSLAVAVVRHGSTCTPDARSVMLQFCVESVVAAVELGSPRPGVVARSAVRMLLEQTYPALPDVAICELAVACELAAVRSANA